MSNRYNFIEETKTNDGKRLYKNIKYPEIPLSENDTYIITARGDRYDVLAEQYYEDKSDWWVISLGNPQYPQNTIYPPIGKLIRIPSDIANIKAEYERLNS